MSLDRKPGSLGKARASRTLATVRPLLELGRGGMATAELARVGGEGGFARLAVVKRLLPEMLGDDEAVRRFLDEARAASYLHHANVVGIQQVGRDDGGYFLVLDYVEGDSLDGLVSRVVERGERMPIDVVLRIFLDGLAGLHAAHEATDPNGEPLGMLHRDVSPQNLLVGCDGVTRLSDFGVARVPGGAEKTSPHRLVGKILYLPPEYLLRQVLDRRLDVYGAGVTLWIALAGRRPFESTRPADLVVRIARDGLPSIQTVRGDVPDALAAVVAKATSRDFDARYATARELADALRELENETGLARHGDVADFVARLTGDEIAARRRQVAALGARAAAEVSVSDALAPEAEASGMATAVGRSPWLFPVAAGIAVVIAALTGRPSGPTKDEVAALPRTVTPAADPAPSVVREEARAVEASPPVIDVRDLPEAPPRHEAKAGAQPRGPVAAVAEQRAPKDVGGRCSDCVSLANPYR